MSEPLTVVEAARRLLESIYRGEKGVESGRAIVELSRAVDAHDEVRPRVGVDERAGAIERAHALLGAARDFCSAYEAAGEHEAPDFSPRLAAASRAMYMAAQRYAYPPDAPPPIGEATAQMDDKLRGGFSVTIDVGKHWRPVDPTYVRRQLDQLERKTWEKIAANADAALGAKVRTIVGAGYALERTVRVTVNVAARIEVLP